MVVTGLGVYSIGQLTLPDEQISRWARAPSTTELASGRVWFDAPIESIVSLPEDATLPGDGCLIRKDRYEQMGKSAGWVAKATLSNEGAVVHAYGTRYLVPLHTLTFHQGKGRLLSTSEAQAKLGAHFTSREMDGLAGAQNPNYGAIRYEELCAGRGQYLFLDGYSADRNGETFDRGTVELSSGPSLAQRRRHRADVCGSGACLIVMPILYMLGILLMWTQSFVVTATLRKSATIERRTRVSWWRWLVSGGAILVAGFAASCVLQVFAPMVGSLAATIFMLAAVAFASRRAVVSSEDLHEGRILPGATLDTSPLSGRPCAYWILDVWQNDRKKTQFVGSQRSTRDLRVDWGHDVGVIAMAGASVDAPAWEVTRPGFDVPGRECMPSLVPSLDHRMRESLLLPGDVVCALGAAVKQPSHSDGMREASGYREPPMETLVRADADEPVVVFEGRRDDVTRRFSRAARHMGLLAVVFALGAAALLAVMTYASVLIASV